MNKCSILQWIVQGIRSKKKEIVEYIKRHKVSVATIQTKLAKYNQFNIPNYNVIRRHGNFNHTPLGGGAVFIHNSVPYEIIGVNTSIQAVTARVRLHAAIRICNIYSPGSEALDYQMLEKLRRQLPQPFIILGDFIAQNIIWRSDNTDATDREVERFITNHNISIMNNGGTHTHIIQHGICNRPYNVFVHVGSRPTLEHSSIAWRQRSLSDIY